MENLQKLDKIIQSFTPQNDTEEVQVLARQAGVAPEKIKVKNLALEWAKNCLIVELHIGRARFERALTPPDLGLNDNDKELEGYLSTLRLGKQLLAAGDYKAILNHLASIEAKARSLLDRYSVKTDFGKAVSCVPKNGISPFEELNQELDKLKSDYKETYKLVLESLQQMRRETEAVMYEAAEKIYHQLNPGSYSVPEHFRNHFIAKAIEQFPDPSTVRASYCFEMELKFVPLSQNEKEITELKHQALNLKAEVTDALKSSYQNQAEKFVQDILVNLRQIIHEQVSLSLETLRRNGYLPGATVVGLKKLVDEVNKLNFIDDHDITQQISRLESMLNKTQKTEPGEAGILLDQLKEESRRFLLELGHNPRTVRKVDADNSTVDYAPSTRKKRRISESSQQFIADEPLARKRR